MTYVPVQTPKGHGRTPLDIPEALVRQLQHSAATGAKCVIDLTEIPEEERPTAEEIGDLRRALVRASYRFFRDKALCKRFTETEIRYWVEPKKPRIKAKPKKAGARK